MSHLLNHNMTLSDELVYLFLLFRLSVLVMLSFYVYPTVPERFAGCHYLPWHDGRRLFLGQLVGRGRPPILPHHQPPLQWTVWFCIFSLPEVLCLPLLQIYEWRRVSDFCCITGSKLKFKEHDTCL